MKNYWSKKECDIIIEMYKNKTAFFGNTMDENPLKFDNMYEMLRHRMGFGEAESNVILASLIKCGAKIV